jgi:hypothetical protein
MIKLSRLLVEATKEISPEQGQKLFVALGLDKTQVSPEEFTMGLNVEMEHANVVQGNLKKLALLVLAHLKEAPDYYTKLQSVEQPDAPSDAGMGSDELPSPQVPPQY